MILENINKEILDELLTIDIKNSKIYYKYRNREWFPDNRSFNSFNSKYVGQECFKTLCHYGYYRGSILGVEIKTHRLLWFYQKGFWPIGIDHIDGNTTNNSLENLRESDQAENLKNLSIRSDNTTGHVGISWFERTKRYRAYIQVGNKQKHLGYFLIWEDAIEARKIAEVEYGYHANHGRQ